MYDPYFNDVSLLLHMNGTDGSTTFTDSSSNAHVVTALVDAQIDTAVYKYGGASGLFNGDVTNDGLDVAASGDFDIPLASDWTLETWVNTSYTTISALVARGNSTFLNGSWLLSLNVSGANGYPSFYIKPTDSSVVSMEAAINVADGSWHHIAVVKLGTTYTLYVDGVSGATMTDAIGISLSPSVPLTVGYQASYGRHFNGNIDDVRITKGVARYLTDFTPPLQQFPDSLPVAAFWVDTGSPGGIGIANAWIFGASNQDGTVLVGFAQEPENPQGYIWTSVNSGVTWSKRTGPGVGSWAGFAMSADGSKIIAVDAGDESSGSVWTSSNYGATWTEQTGAVISNPYGVCCSYDASIIYVIDWQGLCYKSTDSGIVWVATESTATNAVSVACSDDGSIVLVGTETAGDLFLSTNGGTSWTSTLTSVSSGFVAVGMDSIGDNMVAVELNGDVFVTNNGGTAWTNKTNSPNTNGNNAFVSSLGDTMIVQYGGTYYSYDFGATWADDPFGVNNFVTGDSTSGTMLLGADVNWFTYTGLLPSETSFTIISITPDQGSTVGGTPVTIIGTGFDPAATAAIDGNDLTDVTVVDPTTITGITPAGTAGAKDVTVTNP